MNKESDAYSIPLDRLLNTVYSEVPSLLSLMDDCETSVTYGCFYPPFWREKKRNFGNVRAQEAVLTLGLLLAQDYPNNLYYGNEKLLRYVLAGMKYWTRLQHRDGSFDEWRRLEHGQAGTAFSTFAMANAYELIKGFLEESLNKEILTCFRRSANFLCKNSDLAFLNHEAVAIAALYLCYKVLRDNSYLKIIKDKIGLVVDNQSYEGWFKEGNGPDSGYNTVTTSYLAFYYRQSRDRSVLPILKRAVRFNSFLLYPDGFTGGGFNSRCAGMLFPLGFAILSDEMDIARRLAYISLRSLIESKMNGLYTLNDLRKCFTLYLLLWVYSEAKRSKLDTQQKLPLETEGSFARYMRQSGIVVVKTPLYCLVIGARKGCIGAIYSYDAGLTIQMSSPEEYDCLSGVYGKTSDGFIVSNVGFTHPETNEVFRRRSVLTTLHLPLINPKSEVIWKLGGRLIDRPPLISLYHLACDLGLRHKVTAIFDNYKMFTQKRVHKPVLRLTREIGWQNAIITVKNEITFLQPLSYDELYLGETLILPKNTQSEVVGSGDSVDYLFKGRKVMVIRAKERKINVKLGKRGHLRFNDVQPVLALLPLNAKTGKFHVDYTLEMLAGAKW